MITTAQIRGARGVLNWSQGDLSERTGISSTSIGSIENGLTQPRDSTIQLIQKAFEDGGIEFLPDDGIRKKTGYINFYRGEDGFSKFYDDVYETTKRQNKPQEILVSNVDEQEFMKWGKDVFAPHSERMNELDNISYKILVQEGDTNFIASSYAEYRWLPKEFFASVPFYVYGTKLAIILFETELTVMVLDYPTITDAYRKQFEAIWELSKTPNKNKKLD
ncbi:MAG: helix-turn-helix transcriptional regulator [Alphaproteobacteria bacterium]|jgi:transcriptional regulator with XRE-family HTH domain|nr:helix-turn-helix transcriptional regulator [Alphaproteobacteria bacterium]